MASVEVTAEVNSADMLQDTNPSEMTDEASPAEIEEEEEAEEKSLDEMDEEERHAHFMKKTISMGERALDAGETPVGCVIVYENQVVGSGMNDTNRSMNGTRHAEFIAIAQVLQAYPKSALKSMDLYVTVEPCIMCASALRQYRIRSVYYGTGNDRFGGTGGVLTLHSDPSIDPAYPIHTGIFRQEAIMLLRRFYIQENEKAPRPRPKKNRELNTTFEEDPFSIAE